MSIVDRLKRKYLGATAAPVVQVRPRDGDTQLSLSERDRFAIQKSAQISVTVLNESLNIANQSKNRETRESRLRIARERLGELKILAAKFPFLHLQNLQAVEASIVAVEAETRGLFVMDNAPSAVGKTIGELQASPLSTWGNSDLVSGLQFCATMQLRTPLRVLLRHGEIHSAMNTAPPVIAHEMWEGIWIPKTKTWKELNIDLPELPPGTMASALGQVPTDGGDYLPFLVAIRKIVEADDSIDNRIAKLRELLPVCEWQAYVSKHGGVEEIVQYFFPRQIAPMPKLPADTVSELAKLGLDSPSRIAAAPDEVLLGIKGIGPAKLLAMRAHCADMAKHRDAGRAENVIR